MRHRYSGSAIGVFWNVLQPLAMIVVLSIVFTRIMDRGTGDVPYPIYLCAALLPWQAFVECVNRGTHCFVSHAGYLRKLPIPEPVFAAQTTASASIGLAITLVLLLGASLAFGHAPSWHWAIVPIPLALLMLLGFGLALALGTLHAFIRDVGQVVPVALQIGFWLFPICYTADVLPEWFARVLPLNPVWGHLTAARALVVERALPPTSVWAAMLAWTSGSLIVGGVVFGRLRAELRDVL